MAKGKNLQKTEDVTLAPIEDMENDAGEGMELMGVNDLLVPIFSILQKLSPECDKTMPEFIEGAEQGMMIDKSRQQLYDGERGVDVIPCFYDKKIFEWGAKRSGLKGIHPIGTPLLKNAVPNERGIPTLGNGNTLVETAQYFNLLLEENKVHPVVIGMYSTALKKSRTWNSLIKNVEIARADKTTFNPPMYSHVYHLKTVLESNDQGSWFNWDISMARIVDDPELYNAAKTIYHMAIKGNIEVQTESSDNVPF